MVRDFQNADRGRDGLERDVDHHNQRLWKRQKYRSQKEKDVKKKQFRDYKKVAEQQATDTMQNVDEKQRRFYDNLFTSSGSAEAADVKSKAKKSKKPRAKKAKDAKKDEKKTDEEGGDDEPAEEQTDATKKKAPKQGKNAKQGFKAKLEALKSQKTIEEEQREKEQKQFEKKLKVKARYAKQLNRKNKNGQMVMSGMISHLLGKIERGRNN